MIGGQWSPWNVGARTQTLGATLASTSGVTLNSGSSAKGSWVDIGGTTSFAYRGLLVGLFNNSSAHNGALDIGINVGGNRFIIAEDLLFTLCRRALNEGVQHYFLPLNVPAGAQLSARYATQGGTSLTTEVILTGFSAGIAGMAGFSRCRKLFTVGAATARGVQVDPGGTANTKGSWVELLANSPANCVGLQIAIGFAEDIARTGAAKAFLDIGIGSNPNEQILIENIPLAWSTTYDGPLLGNSQLLPMYIPKSSRVIARASCSINTAGDRLIDVAAWGFEP